jgi:plastocyanin
MKALHRISLLLVAPLLLATACSGDGDDGSPLDQEPQGQATVTMGLSSFSPTQVTLLAGGTVTWSNTSGTAHNVTFSAGNAPADIGDHTTGTNDRNFPVVGIFNYTCTNHAGMNGRVEVVVTSAEP